MAFESKDSQNSFINWAFGWLYIELSIIIAVKVLYVGIPNSNTKTITAVTLEIVKLADILL